MNIARWGRLPAIAAEGHLYIPLVSRVAGQIDGATRRVPKGMAVGATVGAASAANATFFRSGLERNLFLDHLPLAIHDLVQIQVVTTLVFRRAE